jgi:hypothetical protein
MPRKPDPLEPWMLDAIQLMIRENLSLRQAAAQLGIEITPQQADNISGRIRFKDALDEARLAYFTEIGSNPRLTKDAVVGQLYQLATRLAADREDFKAADALLKLAKIQGWMGYEPDPLQKAFAALTQEDIDQLRGEIREQRLRRSNPVVADEPPTTEMHSSKPIN